MRFILSWTKFLDLCVHSPESHPVSIHPPVHAMFPLPDGLEWHRCKCCGHVVFQCIECIITVVTKIFLHLSPEIFNEVQLAVKLQQKNAQVTHGLDYLLHEWFLFLKVGLELKDALVAASKRITFTFLASPLETLLRQSTFSKHSLYSFQLVWKLWVGWLWCHLTWTIHLAYGLVFHLV